MNTSTTRSGADDGKLPRPDDPRAQKAYWKARKDRLESSTFTTNGESLQPDEVVFAERMVAGGHSLSWIKAGSAGADKLGPLPTNDFVWHSRGDIVVEHKSLRAETPVDLTHITRQIRNALKKNARAPVVRNVIIDIGDRDVPNSVTNVLKEPDFSARAKIDGLWLMSYGHLISMFENK